MRSISLAGRCAPLLTTNCDYDLHPGGNSKTCLIITCSPSIYNLPETYSTLRFGLRAKRIQNKPKINQERTVAEYKGMHFANQ